MLDEKKEVQEYLCEIKSDKQPRVLPSNLTDKYENKLNGLQDILVLIAREFIFEFMKAKECTKEVHDVCISALRLWCGFDDDETLDKLKKEPIMIKWLNEFPYADKWLKNYYEKIILPNFKAKSEKKKNVKKEALFPLLFPILRNIMKEKRRRCQWILRAKLPLSAVPQAVWDCCFPRTGQSLAATS